MASGYDSFAEAYSAKNEASLLNAYFERPAMVELAGREECLGPAGRSIRH